MLKHSFSFCGVDMREKYGLIVEKAEDVLAPDLRERKVEIPSRDGAWDYGAENYDERRLVITCGALLTREQCRELSYELSRKAEIRLWDEPGKYYVGRIYDSTSIERVVGKARKFQLVFVCEPFAYGEQKTENFVGEKKLEYAGTARAPTRITITNQTGAAVQGLTITMKERV